MNAANLILMLSLIVGFVGCNYSATKGAAGAFDSTTGGGDNSGSGTETIPGFDEVVTKVLGREAAGRCQGCHQHAAGGPLDLTTYEKVKGRLGQVQSAVQGGRMPPGGMSAAATQFILNWIRNGAPREAIVRNTPPTNPGGGGTAPTDPGSGAPVPEPELPALEPTFASLQGRVLERQCVGCHSPGGRASEYDFTSRVSLLASGVVEPGRADHSDLYEVLIEDDPEDRMPPPGRAPVTPEDIMNIRAWIDRGAP